MLAVMLTEFGPPSVLTPAELPDPVPGPGQVVVKAAFANITFVETQISVVLPAAAEQLGGSIGTALLNTIAASSVTGYLASHPHGQEASQLALVHSYTTVFWYWAGIFAAGAIICGALQCHPGLQARTPEPADRRCQNAPSRAWP